MSRRPMRNRESASTAPPRVVESAIRRRVRPLVLVQALVVAVLAVRVLPAVYRTQVSFVGITTSGSRLPTSALGGAGPLAGIAASLGMGAGTDPSESPNFYVELIQSRE